MAQPPVGTGLPAIAIADTPHDCQAEYLPASPEVNAQAPSLASQLPQVLISSRQQHDGAATCGSGLARDSGGKPDTWPPD
jgi:hypothetical protein